MKEILPKMSESIFGRKTMNFEQLLAIFLLIVSIFLAIFNPGIFTFAFVGFALLLPVLFQRPKIFFVILIATKMLINGLYSINIFGDINILKIIGTFIPLFLILYMLLHKINLKRYSFYILIIVFIAEVIISSVLSIYGLRDIRTVEKLLRLLNGITFYFSVPLIFDSEKDIVLLLKVWFVSFSFPLLIGLYQYFTGQLHFQLQIVGDLQLSRIAGIYHDVGTIAFSGLFYVLLTFFLFNNNAANIKKSIYYALLLITTFIVYQTYSKIAAIVISIYLVAGAIYKKKRVLIILSIIVISIIFFTEGSGIYRRIEMDFIAREKWGDSLMFTGRVGIWERNWSEYLDYSLLHKLIGYKSIGAPHNDFLRFLLDYGLLGFLLYTALLLLILLRLLKLLYYTKKQFYRNIFFIAFLSQVGYIIICFGTTPSLYTDFQWFHWGLVGIALVHGRRLNTNIQPHSNND